LKLVNNLIYLVGAEFLSKIATFAALAYMARIAGPVGYGTIEFANAVYLCAGLIVDQGFSIYGAREISKNSGKSNQLTSEITYVRIILAILAYLATVIFVVLLDRPEAVTQLILIYGIGLFAMPLIMTWVFQGHERMDLVAGLNLLRQLLFAGIIFIFLRASQQIWLAGVAEVIGATCIAIYGAWVVYRLYGWRLFSKPVFTYRLLSDGVPIGLSQAFWMVRMYGAMVIIGIIAVPQDVGIFGAAMRVLISLHSFIYLYYFNLLPRLSVYSQNSDGRFSDITSRSLALMSWVCAIIGMGWVLLAPAVMIKIYGSEFTAIAFPIRILSIVFVVAALDGHYRFGLIAAGYQKFEMFASILGAIVTITLIPLGYSVLGMPGSALALSLAEIGVWIFTWQISRKKLVLRDHSKILLRPFLAVLAASITLWLLPANMLFLKAIIGILLLTLLSITIDPSIKFQAKQFITYWNNRKSNTLQEPVEEKVLEDIDFEGSAAIKRNPPL
jgi:PST family polysaccharide transporter